MNKIYILILFLFVICGCSENYDTEITKWIQKSFDGYEIVSWKAYSKYCGTKKKPGLIRADFNDDKMIDFAVLLKNDKGEKAVYKYVVFMKDSKEAYTPYVLDNGYGNKGGLNIFYRIKYHIESSRNWILEIQNLFVKPESKFIFLLQPDTYRVIKGDIENRVSLTLKLPAIGGGECESSSWFWYWDKNTGKFIREWTSD